MVPIHTISRRQLLRLGTLAAIAAAAPSLAFPGSLAARSGGPGLAIGDEVAVDVHALNLRAGPGIGHRVPIELPHDGSGTVLDGPVVANGYTWYRIDVGRVGWAAGEFLRLQEQPDVPQGLRIQVVEGPLNLRVAPSLGGTVITALPVGTTMRVTQTDGGTWADGYHWIAVRVEAQNPVEGFIADGFTAPA